MEKTKARMSLRKQKVILTLCHMLFVLVMVAGISAMYFNSEYGKGFQWIFHETYEGSDAFCNQLGNDINKIFTYISYKDMFETDGSLDMHKPIVGISDGPGFQEELSLDQIIRYAKTLGYYLDENFIVQGSPMSMDDDEPEVNIDYQTYNPDFQGIYELETRMPKDELALDILNHLGEYYSIYYNFIAKQTNVRFRIEYKSNDGETTVYTNVPDMTLEELRGVGEYLYVPGNTIRMDTNLAVVPANVASYLELKNPYDNNRYYMVISVDTTYPYDDAYSQEAFAYRESRNTFIMGMGGVLAGLIGTFATLAILMLLSGHTSGLLDEIRLFPIDKIPTEMCILLWGVAAAVLLYAGSRVGALFMGLFAPQEQLAYWKKVIRMLILYGSSVLCIFSLLRRYKAGTLWKGSLARKAIESSKEYVGRVPYAVGTGFCYLLFLVGNAAMMWGILFLFASRGERLNDHIMLAIFVILLIGADGWIFHQLFRKSVQRDLLDEAISSISKGDTGFRIQTEKLSGKERAMGEHINNISSGLDTALQEKVKSERLKADLITNVSHDIKTPLTSIINYVDLLKREKIGNPKIEAYLEVLDQKSQRLKTLTEDLVEASKASSGNLKLEVSEINVAELVQQTNGEFEERFTIRHLELVSTLPEDVLIIRADGRRLWRVLENLYTNAFKYAMEHSRVYVEVKEDDGRALFTIKNISEKPLNISPDELTERFVRGDVARTTEGSGLGLSIAQSLTQLQGGTFTLTIDGDLFKAEVAFPLVRCERKGEWQVSESVMVEVENPMEEGQES